MATPKNKSPAVKITKVAATPKPVDKLLSTVQLTPNNVLTYNYFGKLKLEHKEELVISNPTDSIVTFKLKCTSPKLIKISPSFGYLKPKGKVTIWVIVNPTSTGNPPTKERISVLLAVAPRDHPPNAEYFWQSVKQPKEPFRRSIKIKFVAQKTPSKASGQKATTQNWVDKIKKVKDDESECGSSARSESDDEEQSGKSKIV